ncbi:MAG: DUF2007 domain-containing protein [Planctomycetota bacterium]|nr:DUF2007 domain-containing protein [Planctomycetota bacterium]
MGKLLEIYSAKDVLQAYLMKSVLEARGFTVVLDNLPLQIALGDLALGTTTAPRLLVDEAHAIEARKIVLELDAAYQYGGSDAESDCDQD